MTSRFTILQHNAINTATNRSLDLIEPPPRVRGAGTESRSQHLPFMQEHEEDEVGGQALALRPQFHYVLLSTGV